MDAILAFPNCPRPYLAHIALLLYAIPFCVGLNALFRPRAALSLLHFPRPLPSASRSPPGSQDYNEKLVDGLVLVYGSRELSVACAALAAYFTGSWEALGWGMFGATIYTVADGVASQSVTGGGQWRHWFFGMVGIVLGSGILGWW
jgi:hypothetical protein